MQGQTNSHKQKGICAINELYGQWIFINIYESKLTKIDTLKKEPYKSLYGTSIWTYNKSGTFINDQGDYETKGNFIMDSKRCKVKIFDNNGEKGDTLVFEITYLDKQYLMLFFNNKDGQIGTTYFYKRK